MRKTRRMSFTLIICFMIFSLVAVGCGSQNNMQGNPETEETKETAAPAEETAAPEKPKEKVTLKLYSPGVTARGSEDQVLMDAVSAKVLSDTGLNIGLQFESSAYDQLINKVNTMIAAGDIDGFNVPWGQLSNWATKPGLLMPLDELLDQYGPNLKALFSEETWKLTKINGKIMGIPVPSPVASWVVPWIRKDLLDQAGLALPKTIDEFEAALRKFKEMDPEMIALATDNPGWIYSNFGGLALPEKQTDDSGNLLMRVGSYYYQTEDSKDYMSTLQRWYKDGLLNGEMFTWDHTKNYEMMTKGKVGAVVSGSWLQSEFDVLNGVDPKNPPKDTDIKQQWVIMDNVVDKHGSPVIMGGEDAPDRFVGILNSSKHAIELIQFLDWMAADVNNIILTEQGIADKHYKLTDGKREAIKASGDVPLISNIVSNFFNAPFTKERTETSVGPIGSEWLKVFNKDTFKISKKVDSHLVYNYVKTQDKMNDIDTLFNEYYQKIILGELPVTAIDEMAEKLDKMGIKEVNAERNEQYQAAIK